ncbi:DUF2243 domain-containing protein [Caulobacter sp. 73W]|uniref:DUF2243 domain-containing protein n=1 Tax=Caulobacter sp. 73W TaxID=3161137 RepID=A0AB39KZ91_9CAUL
MQRTSGDGVFGPAIVIGVALSGFFDGILLHQILQWHHLLSLAEGAPKDIGFQVLADGLFHALMYAVAIAGLAWLWSARRHVSAPGAARWLFAGALIGFGGWNLADVGLFHWILNLHHVRLDTPDWLAWDLIWFVGLGLAPTLWGLLALRGRGGRRGHGIAACLALLAVGGAVWSSAPPPASNRVMVIFAPGVSQVAMMDAVAVVNGRLIDVAHGAMVIELAEPHRAWALYAQGALMVSSAGPSGCLGWTKIA